MSIKSVLLISADSDMTDSVKSALADVDNLTISTQDSSVSQLNGAAFKMASEHDVVIFATDPSNAADLTAIEALTEKRREHSIFLALTDSDMPLSRARALSRAGVDDVLPFPLPGEELVEQIERWSDRLAVTRPIVVGGGREGAVIAVAQARGGIGATTVAVNLADQLQGRKSRFKKDTAHKVAILDLDIQFGTVGDFLDVDPQEGLMQLATDGITPDEMWMEQSLSKSAGGLSVLSSPTRFAPLDAIREDQISSMIQVLRSTHDYVVVDLPRALVSWVEPVLSNADKIIVVADTTVPSIRATRRLIDFYTSENPGMNIEVVINHEKKPFVMATHHKEAAKTLERKFTHWLPHDERAARDASDFGKPLSEVAGRSDLTKAIGVLAKDTAAELPVAQHASN